MKEQSVFTKDVITDKEAFLIEGADIAAPHRVITTEVSEEALRRGEIFSNMIKDGFIADFEKPGDRMAHVSTFAFIDGMIYMTYYANTSTAAEDPNFQTARLAYCPEDDPANMTWLDIQSVGDEVAGRRVNMVYDTIFARVGEDRLYVLWTAKVEDNYYRLYRPFDLKSKTLGAVGVNRLRVGDVTNDFSASGIVSALAANGIGHKTMYSDIGIMQKFTSRVENGETWYYTGAYSGDFNWVIKSRDFITWDYVSQPDFPNQSKWENAVYILGDKLYYFVRQQDFTVGGFLTAYDLEKKTWDKPIEIGDAQSRSDFIFYEGALYLFHAPIDREHIGMVKIDTEDISKSEVVFQAKMPTSCFYPFIQFTGDGSLAMSYTVNRQHIRLARFDLGEILK